MPVLLFKTRFSANFEMSYIMSSRSHSYSVNFSYWCSTVKNPQYFPYTYFAFPLSFYYLAVNWAVTKNFLLKLQSYQLLVCELKNFWSKTFQLQVKMNPFPKFFSCFANGASKQKWSCISNSVKLYFNKLSKA